MALSHAELNLFILKVIGFLRNVTFNYMNIRISHKTVYSGIVYSLVLRQNVASHNVYVT
jgi:hypothetical protein